jgi:S1-C subfamily serine protease
MVYTSAPTFPGNSGGPFIAVRAPFNPAGRAMGIGRQIVVFAGIMLETQLVPAPTPANPIPPLHLGVAVPVDAVLALLESERARSITAQVEELRQN